MKLYHYHFQLITRNKRILQDLQIGKTNTSFLRVPFLAKHFSIFLYSSPDISSSEVLRHRPRNNKYYRKLLTNCNLWSQKNIFKFSTVKTSALHFSKVRNCDHSTWIYLNNINIQTAEKIKFIGFTFNEKLTWSHHINNLKNSFMFKWTKPKKIVTQ